MEGITTRRAVIGVIVIVLIATAFLIQKNLQIEPKKERVNLTKELSAEIERNNWAEQITGKESVEEGSKRYTVLTGTRNTVMGSSEYLETVEIWINEETGAVENVTVVSSIEHECLTDFDCVTGGMGDICTLKSTLPKIASGGSSESMECYSLTACKCFERHCRWVPNKGI